MIEPVTGTNGIIIPPPGYMQGVRELCDRYEILMIADEVMSGFGRTGEWFAVNHWNVIPDIMTMAKGITSAYAPLGAVAMKPEIAATFNDRVFEGGLTLQWTSDIPGGCNCQYQRDAIRSPGGKVKIDWVGDGRNDG